MISHRLIPVVSILTLLTAGAASAVLPEPDHTVYGTVRLFGEAPAGGAVTLYVNGGAEPVASFALGSDPELGDTFVLRVPLDSVDPRAPGTARRGDTAAIYLDGELAGTTVIGARGTVQHLDVDPGDLVLPSLSIGDAALVEGDAGTVDAVFTLSLSTASEDAVEVDWTTADGTATGGSDYQTAFGTATVPPGDSTTTLTVRVLGEELPEGDETFFVHLSNARGANLLDPQGKATILDDDTPPTLAIQNVTITEPVSGSTQAVFAVSLSHPWEEDVTFDFATREGTAEPGLDYLSTSGRGVIAAGGLVTRIEVEVLPDDLDEDDETFALVLRNPAVGSFPGAQTQIEGQGTITDASQFLTFVEVQKDGVGGVEGLAGAFAVAVSPDGSHVYVAGRGDGALALFARRVPGTSSVDGLRPENGNLDFVEAYVDGVDGVDGLARVESVIVSGDGKNVYAAGFGEDAVAVFRRETDPASAAYGRLTFLEAERDGVEDPNDIGGAVEGLGGATALALSPDGEHLYAAGFSDGSVAVFRRDTSDPASAAYGRLTFLEAEIDGADDAGDPGGRVDGLLGASSLVVSPDGAHLYAAGFSASAVAVFERAGSGAGAAFGKLSFLEVQKDGVGGVDGLDGAVAVAISPDGAYLYTAGQRDDAVAVLRRGAGGRLSFVEAVRNAAGGPQGLAGAVAVAVSRDGALVYTAGFLDHAVTAFRRDAATGELTFIEVKSDGDGGVDGLFGATGLAVSTADDRNVYVAGNQDSAVAVFYRDVTAPGDPTVLESTSHQLGVYSADPTVAVRWSGARDDSGIAGYSYLFDDEPSTLPDATVDLEQVDDPHSTVSAALAEGVSHYFHLRTCDRADNCSDAVHLGPFLVDLGAAADPSAVVSTTHPVGEPSLATRIVMTWPPPATAGGAVDALSGVAGYAVAFTQSAAAVCDRQTDLEADQTTVSSAPLANGTYYFHLCTVDRAGNWSSGTTAGRFIVQTVDVTPPAVISVNTVAGSSGGELEAGEEEAASVTQVLVRFSEALFDPPGDSATQDVTRPANYLLVEAGSDGSMETSACGPAAGDDRPFSVDAVAYVTAVRAAALSLNDGFVLPPGRYRLLVCGLIDLSGNPLAGGRFVRDFEVVSESFLLNPNFDRDLSFWIPTPLSTPDISHQPCAGADCADADGAASSGSALVEGSVVSEDIFALSQCVTVDDTSEPLELAARVRVTSPAADPPAVLATAAYYSEPGCAGALLGEMDTRVLSQETAGSWLVVSKREPVPAAARSALVSLAVAKNASGELTVNFDNVFFGRRPEVSLFADGFESGDLSLWSGSMP